jgi:hypothetical protein
MTTVIDFHTNVGTIVSSQPSPVLPADPVKKKVTSFKLDHNKFESKFSDPLALIFVWILVTSLEVALIKYFKVESKIKATFRK